MQLQTETEELEAEVSNLLNALSKSRIDESKSKIYSATTTNTQSAALMRESKQIMGDFEDKCRNYPLNSRVESISTSSSGSYPPSTNISKYVNPKMSRKYKRVKKRLPNKSVRFAGTKKTK